MPVSSALIKKAIIYICCLVLVKTHLRAQEYSYIQYNTQHGLAGSVVYHAVQDKDGFMWFATETGLSRFDGTHFKNFTVRDGLPDNEILRLFVDSRNRVWIMPFRSAICYYFDGKIHNQANDSLLHQLHIQDEVNDVTEDKEGNILISRRSTLHVISPGNKITMPEKNGTGNMLVALTAADPVKGFKIAAAVKPFGFCLFNLYNGKYSLQKVIYPKGRVLEVGRITSNWEILQTNGYFNVSSVAHKVSYNIQPREHVLGFSILSDSTFTVNTTTGALLYGLKSDKPQDYFLKKFAVSSVYTDNEGNHWFTTLGNGIFRLANTGFKTLLYEPKTGMGNPVYCVEKINDRLYAGSGNESLFVIDQKTMSNPEMIRLTKAGMRILSVKAGSRNTIIAGTDDGLFSITGKLARKIIANNSIKNIYDNGPQFIVSTNSGIRIVDKKSLSVQEHDWEKRANVSIQVDSSILIGTVNGLYVAGPNHTAHYLGDRFVQLANRITAMQRATDGVIWIGTHGIGIVGYRNDSILYVFNTDNGLISNTCRSLFVQGNTIWVGTDGGLNKIDLALNGPSITVYDNSDGLPANIINAIYADGDMVYAGTEKGLTFFDQRAVYSKSACKIKMLDIAVSGKTIAATSGITLQKTDDINFSFAGISFQSVGNIQYHYRLLGLDTNWKVTNQNVLAYPSLPAGAYTLELTAFNKWGAQSSTITFPFIVEKTFFEKNGIRLLLLLTMLSLGWLVAWFVIKRIKRREEEKTKTNKRIYALEQMALKSQMNPHFIFNSLNSIQQFVIDKDILGANKYIAAFSRLIRQTLDNSAKEKITIAEEARYLSTYLSLEKTRMEDMFDYTISIDKDLPVDELLVPPMLLQPYIENSLRHGIRYLSKKTGNIQVTIKMDGNHVVCTIEDNGVGRALATLYKGNNKIEYQSKGMLLTKERIDLVNEKNPQKITISITDMEDKSGKPAGTRVTIHFPVEYNH